MKAILKLVSVTVVCAAVMACSDGGSDDARDDEPASAKETPIADSLKQPMDKAAAVEDVAMERKAEMDKRLAEMEGEDNADDEP